MLIHPALIILALAFVLFGVIVLADHFIDRAWTKCTRCPVHYSQFGDTTIDIPVNDSVTTWTGLCPDCAASARRNWDEICQRDLQRTPEGAD